MKKYEFEPKVLTNKVSDELKASYLELQKFQHNQFLLTEYLKGRINYEQYMGYRVKYADEV